MPKLSIVVPVYNVEEYVEKCLESILSQTFTDYEVIIIDDGSTDKSGIICDECAKKDDRVKVIHQRNQGVSAARNVGLEIATGDYISFIDSDDRIHKDMYEKMLGLAIDHDIDIVACDYIQANGNDYRPESDCIRILNRDELLLDAFGIPSLLLSVCWNKVFSRRCILDSKFDTNLKNYEDTMFLCDCYLNCNGAIYIGNKYYIVTVRSESASRQKSCKTITYKFDGCLSLYDSMMRREISKTCRKQIADKTLDSLLKHAKEAKSLKESDNESILKTIKREIVKKSISALIQGNISIKKVRGYIYSAMSI